MKHGDWHPNGHDRLHVNSVGMQSWHQHDERRAAASVNTPTSCRAMRHAAQIQQTQGTANVSVPGACRHT
jgi:hypothetical protein